MEAIKSPFTNEQVERLNDYQSKGSFHPFTCCGDKIPECKRSKAYSQRFEGLEVPYTDENEGILTATNEGWVCPCGKYKQNWAHQFMAARNSQ